MKLQATPTHPGAECDDERASKHEYHNFLRSLCGLTEDDLKLYRRASVHTNVKAIACREHACVSVDLMSSSTQYVPAALLVYGYESSLREAARKYVYFNTTSTSDSHWALAQDWGGLRWSRKLQIPVIEYINRRQPPLVPCLPGRLARMLERCDSRMRAFVQTSWRFKSLGDHLSPAQLVATKMWRSV